MTDECSVDVSAMTSADSIEGEDLVDTNLLRDMAGGAYEYISTQQWCERVDRQYLAYGLGGVIAVFLFQIIPRFKDVDKCMWVIFGDLPPAYLVVEDNPTAADAIDGYCSEMEAWVEAVRNGESVDELIPVNAAATPEYAEQLNGRLEFLRSKILPLLEQKIDRPQSGEIPLA
jgi:hypothetical protein